MKKYLLLLFLILSIVSFADDEEIDYSQIPQNIMDSITANAEKRYPTDYEMQNYIIDQQARAYLKNRRIKGNKDTSNSNIEKRVDDNFIEYKGLTLFSPVNDSEYNYYAINEDMGFYFSFIKSKENFNCGAFFKIQDETLILNAIDSFVLNIDNKDYNIPAKKATNNDGEIEYSANQTSFDYPFFKALLNAKKIDIALTNKNKILYSFHVSEDSVSKINIFSEFCIKKMNM